MLSVQKVKIFPVGKKIILLKIYLEMTAVTFLILKGGYCVVNLKQLISLALCEQFSTAEKAAIIQRAEVTENVKNKEFKI